MGNVIKTLVFMGVLIFVLMWFAQLIGGPTAGMLALLAGVAGFCVAYKYADQKILGLYNAKEVDESSSPALYQVVAEVMQRANLPMPKVYVVDELQPNAFAVGTCPQKASIVVTRGALNLLDGRELRTVIAHECSHIRRRDSLIYSVVAVTIGVLTDFADIMENSAYQSKDKNAEEQSILKHRRWGGPVYMLMTFVRFLAAMVVQVSVTRSQDYESDRWAAELCRDPEALASALHKMQHLARQIVMKPAEKHPTTLPMLMVNPLFSDPIKSLFSPHPLTEVRIKRLLSTGSGS